MAGEKRAATLTIEEWIAFQNGSLSWNQGRGDGKEKKSKKRGAVFEARQTKELSGIRASI